jgi:glutathione S-transferase
MKLYMHPASTTCRPILLFAAEHDVSMDMQVIDLMAGEHLKEPFLKLNPNGLVPVLQDGDFVLTESSAILRYLAETIDSPTYPVDLKKRARVNELMDWFNTNFYREYAYNLVYPQVFPHHKREPEAAQKATLERGREKAKAALNVLNQHILGHGAPYLTGSAITIADYFGAALLSCGELIGIDLRPYPKAAQWFDKMKAMSSWNRVCEAHNGFVASLKGKPFTTVA